MRAIADAFRGRGPKKPSKKKPSPMRAILSKVIVRRDAPIIQTEGGIFIPPHSRIIPWTGEVLAVGPNVTQSIKVGDHVLMPSLVGEFILGNRMFVAIESDQIFAVVDKDVKVTSLPPNLPGANFDGPGQLNPEHLL